MRSPLGDGGTTSDHSPEVMTLAAGVTPTAIAGGYEDTLAIGSDGHLYAWENNANGELGDCTRTALDKPPFSWTTGPLTCGWVLGDKPAPKSRGRG